MKDFIKVTTRQGYSELVKISKISGCRDNVNHAILYCEYGKKLVEIEIRENVEEIESLLENKDSEEEVINHEIDFLKNKCYRSTIKELVDTKQDLYFIHDSRIYNTVINLKTLEKPFPTSTHIKEFYYSIIYNINGKIITDILDKDASVYVIPEDVIRIYI